MKFDIKEFLEKVKADAGLDDPDVIALLTRVTIAAGQIQTRALMGQDVTADMRHLEAIAANLDERARQVLTVNFATWIQNLLAKALGVALTA